MGSGGDAELASKRSTTTVRIYAGDQALLGRIIRFESAKHDRKVSVAQVVHDALEPWRRADAEREKERGSE